MYRYISSGLISLTSHVTPHMLPLMKAPKKNPAAVALGRLGGKAKAAKLSAAERAEIGKRLAEARKSIPAAERRRIAKLAVTARERKRRGKGEMK